MTAVAARSELRIYRCPTPEHLKRLNAMLGEDGLPMFARHGIEVLDAWTVALGASTPVLLYLCPFDDLAERNAAWAAVERDGDWQLTKKRHAAELSTLTVTLEFWWLRSISTLSLAGGAGHQVDLVCETPGRPADEPGQFEILYGRSARRLVISDDAAPFAAADARRVRLARVAWSPAVGRPVAFP